jgi:hypothetical protein
MEPEGSLPRLQEPATCPYPEPDLIQSILTIPLILTDVNARLILKWIFMKGVMNWTDLAQGGGLL